MYSEGREYYWTKNGDILDDDAVVPTKKFGGGKIMIWGCMTYYGVGYFCKIDDILDAELYTKILRGELMNTIEYYGLDIDDVIFQHDLDPKHTAAKSEEVLDELGLDVMEWPAQSPDLNPIEHLWDQYKLSLKEKNRVYISKDELWNDIQEVTANENEEKCRTLIASMPARVQAVIQAKGGYTKY